MKKSILLGIGLGIIMLTLSSCRGMLRLNQYEGAQLVNAIEQRDFAAIVALNPQFEQLYSQHVDTDAKKEKITAFLIDMANNIEKKEPGTFMSLQLMLKSNDEKMVTLGVETAVKKFDEAVFAYAGTLEQEKVFEKIFKDY